MRLMRNFGFAGVDRVIHPGTNGKMTEICAAMGLTNLESIDTVFAQNRQRHRLYSAALQDLPGVHLLSFPHGEENNSHYVVIELADSARRDHLVATLEAEGVLARRYFWPGCHRMEPYASLQPHANLLLPCTEDIAGKVVVLPNGHDVGPEAVTLIADVIRTVVSA
jgi:dTDP-4-amino-4,6-dideoxygalactose transaminase